MRKPIKVALVGNPNTGKTSIFNQLTGLNQKVGNYPGVTVEKKEGACTLTQGIKARIIDLPGTYSLNASSADESIVTELLTNNQNKDYPDLAVVVAEVENLKRNLLLFTQIKDLGIPSVLVINMADRMARKGISIDITALEKKLDTKIALVSARKKQDINKVKELIGNYDQLSSASLIDISAIDVDYFKRLTGVFKQVSPYKLWLSITQNTNTESHTSKEILAVLGEKEKSTSILKRLQQREIIKRYQFINNSLKDIYLANPITATGFSSKLDRILTHKVLGYFIFFAILLFMFQAIYNWSEYPMDFIEESFVWLGDWIKNTLPAGVLTNLLTEGVVAGLGGVIIFIPQIAFLFLLIAILEESGYMSRVVFLMDRTMRRFGLSGKSVVPLISGTACAIPAVMATRNIENWKERLITILVAPFVTCAARLPVYSIITALVIPQNFFLGFSLKALTLMGLYLLGFATALISSIILNKFLKISRKSYLVAEMPSYKLPMLKNVLFTVIEKTKSFVFDAGKIILSISIILWVLASYGPGKNFEFAENIVSKKFENQQLSKEQLDQKIASFKLENSYIGIAGHAIEPVLKPLGYDWKIGIGIISSFAAREVFVSTLATIYSIGSDDQTAVRERMALEKKENGEAVYNFATGISLLLFYAFAMQCMSTLAIVKRETNSWKWPTLQFFAMSIIAYIAALLAYQVLK